MKIRIMIQDYEVLRGQTPEEAIARQGHTCVWEGDIEILKENVYITKISILAEGEPQPICDIPFSINRGWYMWVPPDDFSFGDPEQMPEFALINPGQVITLEDTSQIGPPQMYDKEKEDKKCGLL